MDYNEKKQALVVYGKEEKISTLARKFASLSGKQFYDFFSNRAVGLPRTINCLALYNVLNERLKTLTASEVNKDKAIRLQSYDKFSEVELYDLFVSLCPTKEAYRQYRINLFTLILLNYESLKLTDGEITYLSNVTKTPIEKVDYYFQYVTSASYEMVNTFDGQDIDKLVEGFNKSAVIADIINLAEKYGIELKQKYTKDELVEEVKNYLKISDAYTLDLEAEIDKSTISDLNLFCTKRNIPLASSMNKDNLIKYFFFILEHAEIPTTEVTNLVVPAEFEPLEFKVDLSPYKGFKNEVTDPIKQIIIWAGKEETVESQVEAKAVAPQAEEAVEEAEELEEEPQEETTQETVEETEEAEEVEELEEATEELDEASNEDFEEVIYVDEDGNPVNPEDVEEVIEDEETEYLEEEAPEEETEEAAEEEPQEEAEETEEAIDATPVVEEEKEEKKEIDEQQELKKKIADAQKKEKLALSFGNVEESDLYGDETLYKSLKPPVKLIASVIGCLLVAAAIIILVIAYLPH